MDGWALSASTAVSHFRIRYLANRIMDKPTLRRLVLVLILFGLLVPAATAATRPLSRSNTTLEALSIEARVAHQQAIERIYWQHRLWPAENPNPKLALKQSCF